MEAEARRQLSCNFALTDRCIPRPGIPGNRFDIDGERCYIGTMNGFICKDCEIDTLAINEYYMVTAPVWEAACPEHRGMLCIGCLENRLGRQLTASDFTDAPINRGVFQYSERLAARLAAQ